MIRTFPLTLIRNRGWFGKLRKFKIFVHSARGIVQVGTIARGQTVTVQIPQDAHRIYCSLDGCGSEPMDLRPLYAGATVYINSWFTLNPFVNLGFSGFPLTMELHPR